MEHTNWFSWSALILVGAGLMPGFATADQEEEEKKPRRIIQRIETNGPMQIWMDEETGPQFFIRQGSGETRYWIGVRCVPTDNSDAEGVAVEGVMEGSPAEKAGIKAGDLIVKIDDKKLEGIPQLIQIVQEHGEKQMSLVVERDGESITVEVMPAEREDMQIMNDFDLDLDSIPGLDQDTMEQLKSWMERSGRPGGMGFQFFGPGVVLSEEDNGEFPGNMSISVKREGDGPTTIKIEKDGKTYEADENSLDKLPEDVRPWAEKFIGRANGAPGHAFNLGSNVNIRRFLNRVTPGQEDRDIIRRWRENRGDAEAEIDETEEEETETFDNSDRIRELEEQLEKLRATLEELKSESK